MSTDMIWQTAATSSAATERLGELLGKLLKPPALIELRSDLGGGKTTFVRGLARGFGSPDTVTSPTFTLSKIYKNKQGQEIHHFDFYRLSEPGILSDQLAESLQNQDAITVTEWSNIVKNVLPEKRLTVQLKPTAVSEDERQITIHYPENHEEVIKQIESEYLEVRP